MTFAGLAEVERLQAEFGLPSVHLVKPGVGEATRVLHPPAAVEGARAAGPRRRSWPHLLVLAEERGVPWRSTTT